MKKIYVFCLCFFQIVHACDSRYFLSRTEIHNLETLYRQGMLLDELVQRAEYLANAAQHRALAFLYSVFSETQAKKDVDVRVQNAFFIASRYSDAHIKKFLRTHTDVIVKLEEQYPLHR
ncbi:hypothetical protein EBQ93_02060 [bacterium]|nr:hypothetical protein [bacterium]